MLSDMTKTKCVKIADAMYIPSSLNFVPLKIVPLVINKPMPSAVALDEARGPHRKAGSCRCRHFDELGWCDKISGQVKFFASKLGPLMKSVWQQSLLSLK